MSHSEFSVIVRAIEKLSRDELLSLQSTINGKINPTSHSSHILTETEKDYLRTLFS
ncbi:hypothetical protein [Aliivibrio kagoshimensis]|jgi:hypothetical protein|uniref:hypothetical protein n=1 Tax=Aliivibrio kagoshimensis TaxID=2910230 RepID=UPI003D0C20A8